MATITNEQMIDLIDNRLDAAERGELETAMAQDADARARYEALHFSVALVREAGLQQQVARIRQELAAGKVVAMERPKAVVRPLFGNALRIAVMVLVVFGAAVVYQLVSTTGRGVADSAFTGYELTTSRGGTAEGDLEAAYRAKDWKSVQAIAGKLPNKTAKAWFLAGVADMELREYSAAVTNFISLQEQNERIADPAYKEEGEYYLALAYLGSGKTSRGVELIEKIRADKNHLFHNQAKEISATTLKTLEIKGE